MTVGYWIVAALVAAAIFLGIKYFVQVSRRFAGERVIVCPETGKPATVEVDAPHAAFSSLLGQTDLRLQNCLRWPLRQDCGQECLLQIDVVPDECRVRSVLEKWYPEKRCAFCKRPFAEIQLVDHKPALLNEQGETVEWSQIPLLEVTDVMARYKPVCWNCHIAQTFHREHGDLVVERPVM